MKSTNRTILRLLTAAAFLAPVPALSLETFPLPSPCRVLDTRLISPGDPISSSTPFSFKVRGDTSGQGGELVSGTPCAIPSLAEVAVLSLVVVSPSTNGNVKLVERGGAVGLSSRMNVTGGENRNVEMMVRLGEYEEGEEDLVMVTTVGEAHYVVDLVGYMSTADPCDVVSQEEDSLVRVSLLPYREDGTRGLLSDNWTLTTATEHAGYPASKLKNNNLSDQWWAWNQKPSGTWISAVSDVAGFDRVIGAVGILNINWVNSDPPSQGTWRVRIDDEYPLADRIRPAITAITLTNLSGSISDISGPVDPPSAPQPIGYVSTRLTANNITLNTGVLVEFANHHDTERPLVRNILQPPLVGEQVLRVHTRMDNSTSVFPTISVTCTPTSGPSFALSAGIVEPTIEGYIIDFRWDATQLTVPSATLKFDITGTASGGHTPEFIGVELVQELSGIPYDSAELPITGYNHTQLPDFEIPSGSTTSILVTFSSAAANIFDTPLKLGRFLACSTLSADLVSPDGFNATEAYDESGLGWVEAELTVTAVPHSQIFSDLTNFKNAVGVVTNQPFTRSGTIRGRGVVPFLLIPFEHDLKSSMWVMLTSWETPHAGWWTGDGEASERWDLNFGVREARARRLG